MRAIYFLPILTVPLLMFAQQAPDTGTSPEWDVKANMKSLVADVGKLEPFFHQLKPEEWIARGASETYVDQLESAKASIQHLIAATNGLAADPDRLVTAVDAFFRMERVELLLGSLNEGVRKYGTPETANQLALILASNNIHRDRLRQHITDLAAAKEQELKLMDQEAQRCRGALSQQGSEPKSSPKTNKQERK